MSRHDSELGTCGYEIQLPDRRLFMFGKKIRNWLHNCLEKKRCRRRLPWLFTLLWHLLASVYLDSAITTSLQQVLSVIRVDHACTSVSQDGGLASGLACLLSSKQFPVVLTTR